VHGRPRLYRCKSLFAEIYVRATASPDSEAPRYDNAIMSLPPRSPSPSHSLSSRGPSAVRSFSPNSCFRLACEPPDPPRPFSTGTPPLCSVPIVTRRAGVNITIRKCARSRSSVFLFRCSRLSCLSCSFSFSPFFPSATPRRRHDARARRFFASLCLSLSLSLSFSLADPKRIPPFPPRERRSALPSGVIMRAIIGGGEHYFLRLRAISHARSAFRGA